MSVDEIKVDIIKIMKENFQRKIYGEEIIIPNNINYGITEEAFGLIIQDLERQNFIKLPSAKKRGIPAIFWWEDAIVYDKEIERFIEDKIRFAKRDYFESIKEDFNLLKLELGKMKNEIFELKESLKNEEIKEESLRSKLVDYANIIGPFFNLLPLFFNN